MHSSAEKWAGNILKRSDNNPIKTQFDLYYLFLIVGLGKGKTYDTSKSELKDLVRNVTEDFQEYKHLLAGLLLSAELTNSGHNLDKKKVQKKVVELLRADSSVYLSQSAIDTMNSYALAGFEIVREKYTSPRTDVYDFLLWYYYEMLPECFSSKEWQ
jgi:hypothetical protein